MLGFGRIIASEIEVPNMLANLVCSGWAVVQSDDATEPYLMPAVPRPLGGRSRGQLRQPAGGQDDAAHKRVVSPRGSRIVPNKAEKLSVLKRSVQNYSMEKPYINRYLIYQRDTSAAASTTSLAQGVVRKIKRFAFAVA
jgi:hypothetical protein